MARGVRQFARLTRPARRRDEIPAPGLDVLAEILHDTGQHLLGQAIEAEVADWIERQASLTDRRGRQ